MRLKLGVLSGRPRADKCFGILLVALPSLASLAKTQGLDDGLRKRRRGEEQKVKMLLGRKYTEDQNCETIGEKNDFVHAQYNCKCQREPASVLS